MAVSQAQRKLYIKLKKGTIHEVANVTPRKKDGELMVMARCGVHIICGENDLFWDWLSPSEIDCHICGSNHEWYTYVDYGSTYATSTTYSFSTNVSASGADSDTWTWTLK